MKKSQPTLKIKTITFSRQMTKDFDHETMNSRLKFGRTKNQYLMSRTTKENSVEQKQDKHITEIFNVRTIHPSSSQILLHRKKLNQILTRHQSHHRISPCNSSKPYFLKRNLSNFEKFTTIDSKTKVEASERIGSFSSLRRKQKSKTSKPIEYAPIQKKRLQINITDNIFSINLNNYCELLESAAKLHKIQLQFLDNNKPPIVIVGGGNNCKLVKDVLNKRWWLRIKEKKNSEPINFNEINFIWTQIKVKEYFEHQITQGKFIHNHFQFNDELGNKKQLFMNLKSYYESQGKDPFIFVPLTFHLKNPSGYEFQEFKSRFQSQKQKHPAKSQLWIVKPGENSNRGRGITIHSQFQQILKLIKEQTSGDDKSTQSHTLIIQKYIERPFLYQKRKFDIRCYYLLVCLNNKIKAYWYKQGYIRTSCFEFNCGSQNTENIFVHLTNDAVQKNHQNYGKFQEGNKIDFSTFKKYLIAKFPNQHFDFDNQVYPAMKSMALDSIKATYKKMKKSTNLMFQIFGLDFMIDDNFKPWLIQVNTNPCLQTSCLILERIIPKMLDETFQLSLDLIFPPPKTWNNSRKHLVPNNIKSRFELIFDEQKEEKLCQEL